MIRKLEEQAADVTRFGDDQTVIGMRQRRKFQILGKYRGLDTGAGSGTYYSISQ